jgi:pimeloyl-ACP methyl ester carboxylesterase
MTERISRRRFLGAGVAVTLAAAGLDCSDEGQEGGPVSEATTSAGEAQFATNSGVGIYYEVHGRNRERPLLLHHGFTSSVRDWREAGYIDALKDDFLVVAMDARGHGKSDKPHDEADYTLELRTADIVAVLDAVGIARVHYWGYSMGARTGFAFLQMHGDRAASFINGAGAGSSPKLEEAALRRRAAALAAGDGSAYRNRNILDNDFQALAAASLGLLSWDGVDASTLRFPSLHYAGDQDPLMPAARRAAERMPGALFRLIPGLDHYTAFFESGPALGLAREFLLAQAPLR